ncbi:MAG: sigma-70 family RNA polymerase sigma factor [Myxococcales bacterium]|nr:sigma-70 family RNA polymerase sigma factor [Myxococcales bacterium]
MEDRELVAAWRGGDRGAGEQLFARHFHPISRFFRNKLGTGVDDLIQRTFMAVLEGRDRMQHDGSFRGYLFGTAYNVLRGHLRELDRERKFDLESSAIMDLDPSPSTVHGRHEEQRLLLLALRRVPFEHQVALELMYWEGLNAAEIAEIVGVSHSTMRSRIQRARKLVEQAIHELSDSSELATSTVDELEAWAAGIRNTLEGAE